jgi:hypothetical protein
LSAAGEWAAGAATVTHQWSTAGGQYVTVGCDILAGGGAQPDVVLRSPRMKMGFRDSRGLKGPGFLVFN